MNKAPINDELLGSFLPSFSILTMLHIPNTPRLSNTTLSVIAKYCVALEDLHLGGTPTDYNLQFSVEGFEYFKQAKFMLKSIKLDFCARVGDQAIEIITELFGESLVEL